MARSFSSYTLEEFHTFIQQVNVRRAITHIQIHHTWKPRKTDYKGESTIYSMWHYHTKTRGWRDIGQHFTVSPDGLIWDGRSLELDPAGIAGHNNGGLMFEIIGNFDIGEEELVGAQLNSALGAVKICLQKFQLPYEQIVFHREHAAKTCPGTGIKKDWFVDRVRSWTPSVPASKPNAEEAISYSEVFKDLPKKHYATEAIEQLAELNMVRGTSKDTFGLNQPLTREDAAILVYRFMQQFPKPIQEGDRQNINISFEDVPKEHYAWEAIDFLTQNGIIKGVAINRFGLQQPLSRGDAALLFYRLWQKYKEESADNETNIDSLPFEDVPENHYAREAIVTLAREGIIQGITKNEYGINEPLTREDGALILYRMWKKLKD